MREGRLSRLPHRQIGHAVEIVVVGYKMGQLVPLHLGDILLVQGSRSNIAALSDDNTFRIIGTLDEKRPNIRRAPYGVTRLSGSGRWSGDSDDPRLAVRRRPGGFQRSCRTAAAYRRPFADPTGRRRPDSLRPVSASPARRKSAKPTDPRAAWPAYRPFPFRRTGAFLLDRLADRRPGRSDGLSSARPVSLKRPVNSWSAFTPAAAQSPTRSRM